MANSYAQIYVHITFHVKDDSRIDKEDLPNLCKYITGINIIAPTGLLDFFLLNFKMKC